MKKNSNQKAKISKVATFTAILFLGAILVACVNPQGKTIYATEAAKHNTAFTPESLDHQWTQKAQANQTPLSFLSMGPSNQEFQKARDVNSGKIDVSKYR